MNQFASFSWYSTPRGTTTTVRNRDGRRICDVIPHTGDTATVRLITNAPQLLVSLRFAVGLLKKAGDHQDLQEHLQKMIDIVEPNDAVARKSLLASLVD